MAITNITVTPQGIDYYIRFNSTILGGDVDNILIEYGPDSNYGSLAYGAIENFGPPISVLDVILGPLVEPFHFRCTVNPFVGPPDSSDDQIYPTPINNSSSNTSVPIGAIPEISDGLHGTIRFGYNRR